LIKRRDAFDRDFAFCQPRCLVDRGKGYLGILLPFALNFSPNGVSAPPPWGFVWQAPHACFVSVANCAVAAAGREIISEVAPTTTSTAAALQVMTNHCFLCIFIIPLVLYLYISVRSRTSMLGTHLLILGLPLGFVCAVSYKAPPLPLAQALSVRADQVVRAVAENLLTLKAPRNKRPDARLVDRGLRSCQLHSRVRAALSASSEE
jgi:hypothetical protein